MKPIGERSEQCVLVTDARAVGIVGGGTAAWASAIGFAKRGWDVTVDDMGRVTRGVRIELLAAEAVRQLDHLGVDRRALSKIGSPCPGTWSRWDANSPQEVDQSSNLWGSAWAIEKGRLDTLLRDLAMRMGVEIGRVTTDTASPKNGAWRILATGAAPRRTGDAEAIDDLIAITVCGPLRTACSATDARLLIEALPEGWAYGLLGPARCAGAAFITDAAVLKGRNWRSIAIEALRTTERIWALVDGLAGPLHLSAVPVPCRWCPVLAKDCVVRAGDAQASHDPIAGRGIWHALWSANRIAECLDGTGGSLAAMEQATRLGYCDYLKRRQQLYTQGLYRFGSPFWSRRVHRAALVDERWAFNR